jgi:hypothetical protein
MDHEHRKEKSLPLALEVASEVKSTTVTVVLSNGLRIEGLTAEQAICAAVRLR